RLPSVVGEQMTFWFLAYWKSSYCSPYEACTCRLHMWMASDFAQPSVGRALPDELTSSLQSCADAAAIPKPIAATDAQTATTRTVKRAMKFPPYLLGFPYKRMLAGLRATSQAHGRGGVVAVPRRTKGAIGCPLRMCNACVASATIGAG